MIIPNMILQKLTNISEENFCRKQVSCKNCAICCDKLLLKYNLLAGAFPLIALAYEYMLTYLLLE